MALTIHSLLLGFEAIEVSDESMNISGCLGRVAVLSNHLCQAQLSNTPGPDGLYISYDQNLPLVLSCPCPSSELCHSQESGYKLGEIAVKCLRFAFRTSRMEFKAVIPKTVFRTLHSFVSLSCGILTLYTL